ncbi:5'-methylthioadenosine/adenosylhomocysteine nucleosidase [Ectobacillus antri]|jgi:adenosylhomocysteine nucleosidase|uniref:adenosylhomocysteine nucleosidase n=1 Tax=Ectobacillus antri TaxID=2486280 RepID=A0ABT6H8C7_9BACI|nr:5'-methylthioadenosine/adenosylhomocysteine nucleosidase [Ectobacillus antri]MDG4657199.1 5'-methylthioadenosine/adenosylhomocysteine nucleosidase [Ectobacillus antri]MDG5755212.1 5'-methylthioadenosine/adenosylhomocysteine nucleosidase [Ectobacillus antri]
MKWIKYVMLVVLLCSMSVPVEAYEEKSSLTIGIIAPMEEELKLLRSKMDIESTEKLANFEFYKGTLDGVDTVLVRSGIGKVNSAVAAQILITLYKVNFLINSGVAGALNPKLKVGDILISRDSVQHDVDQTAIDEPPGKFEDADVIYYKADERLVRLAQEATKGLPGVKSYIGRVASGDQFVSEEKRRNEIISTFQADVVEMEGGAIGQVAYLNRIPYIIIRSISDPASEGGGEDYQKFVKLAAKNAGYLIEEMIKRLPESN